MNNRTPLISLRLTACAVAVSVLFGCGGSDTADTTPTAVQSESVQMVQTPTAVTVSTLPDASGSPLAAPDKWAAMQYAFSASTAAGPSYAGTLLLRSETEDGRTELEGRLTLNAPAAPTNTSQQMPALQTDLKSQQAALRSALISHIDALRQKLKADLQAASDSAQRTQAKLDFTDAFKALTTQYQDDVAALIASYRDQLAQSAATSGTLAGRYSGRGDDARRGYEVEGSIAADGTISLTIKLGEDRVLKLSGTESNGALSGTFTGPANSDSGTWSATAGATSAPAPAPAAVGTYDAGLAEYLADCSGCHAAGSVDTAGFAGDLAGKQAKLVSNLGSISGAMNGISLTSQQILDLAAFLGTVK
jgi:hypothetical protein